MTVPLTSHLEIDLNIISQQGEIASIERQNPKSYHLESQLTYRVPRAARTLPELEKPRTPMAAHWADLESLLGSAQVSAYYHSLYERKVQFLSMRMDHIREIPRKHNMFDCDTILELTHPDSKQKALLIQADMDVVTDGSDSDRTTEIDTSARFYQPFTAYNWAKRTSNPNPLTQSYRKEETALKEQLGQPNLSDNDRYVAGRRLRVVRQTLEALKYRSSLVAHLDPFIVLPIYMVKEETSHRPGVGDYCLVFHGDLILPAIVGDTGPNSKLGEASLKIARRIDPGIDGQAASRPVSSLGVTYLVFPGSAEKRMGPPDLSHWEKECARLFTRMGGSAESIHSWKTARTQPTNNQVPEPAVDTE